MEYEKWIDDFMSAWKTRDVEVVMETIAQDCEYYETVFDRPCETFDDIKKLWKVVPTNQSDIEYSYKILAQDNESCIVNFFVTRKLLPSGVIQDVDGIFQISVDENNKCTFFKQWRSSKEIIN